jgi:hypothetical protein
MEKNSEINYDLWLIYLLYEIMKLHVNMAKLIHKELCILVIFISYSFFIPPLFLCFTLSVVTDTFVFLCLLFFFCSYMFDSLIYLNLWLSSIPFGVKIN